MPIKQLLCARHRGEALEFPRGIEQIIVRRDMRCAQEIRQPGESHDTREHPEMV